jgi:hypothetical protein
MKCIDIFGNSVSLKGDSAIYSHDEIIIKNTTAHGKNE